MELYGVLQWCTSLGRTRLDVFWTQYVGPWLNAQDPTFSLGVLHPQSQLVLPMVLSSEVKISHEFTMQQHATNNYTASQLLLCWLLRLSTQDGFSKRGDLPAPDCSLKIRSDLKKRSSHGVQQRLAILGCSCLSTAAKQTTCRWTTWCSLGSKKDYLGSVDERNSQGCCRKFPDRGVGRRAHRVWAGGFWNSRDHREFAEGL